MIGMELRAGLVQIRSSILPTLAALGGMVIPALIFISLNSTEAPWATVMPTDVALAVGALSLLGKRVNPAVRLFLMTLAVADDFFSLIAIAIFFRSDLDLASAFYTLGAALIGSVLPTRETLLRYLAQAVTFVVIPIYIWANLFSVIDFGKFGSPLAITIILSRVLGKVIGITLTTWALIKFSKLSLPPQLDLVEVAGIGLLSGMGMTVSLVIAEITVTSSNVLAEVRAGLFLAAVISGLLGVLWLRRFPAAL